MRGARSFFKLILMIIDLISVNLAYISSFYLINKGINLAQYIQNYKKYALIITTIYLISFYVFKNYESLWSYASTDEFLLAIWSCLAASLITFLYTSVINQIITYNISVLSSIFIMFFVLGFRASFKIYRRSIVALNNINKNKYKRVMIIGAGATGAMIIKEMKMHPEMGYKPAVFIDDDDSKKGTTIGGIKVAGNRTTIKDIVKNEEIGLILFAIPSIDYRNKKEILDICKSIGCKVEIVPGISDLIDGKVSLKKVRDVNYEDLLGRPPVQLDAEGIDEYISGSTIMITGGGGSIGSEICRQVAKFNPKEVILIDNYENGVYELQQEFKCSNVEINLKCVITSITDKRRVEKAFIEYRPNVVFHAAAHKHVPLMEDNPEESVINNVYGTLNLVEIADLYGVMRFVMISTDKAVNPTNIMGATKRLCEMIVQSMNKRSKTQFVAVRFGNVLGSNGSVIPLFKKQIAHGGPVTVTHPEINRFFMTIPEASQLVLQAGAFAKGGEIFVLDMQEPVKIYDLACDLIRLSGFEPNEDIKIEIIGLRPGEKLYEEVLTAEEGLNKTIHDKIFVGRPTFDDYETLRVKLSELRTIVETGNREELINKIQEIVPTYKRTSYQEVAAGICK